MKEGVLEDRERIFRYVYIPHFGQGLLIAVIKINKKCTAVQGNKSYAKSLSRQLVVALWWIFGGQEDTRGFSLRHAASIKFCLLP